MSTVETVRGPVDLDALGPTLMHEHVFILEQEMLANYGTLWGEPYWDEEERVADAVAKASDARDAGIATIVDCTAPGQGRSVARVRRVAQAADVNVIVATGLYTFVELPGFLARRTDEFLAELFVRELREGIDDTGIKAAFIKCAVEQGGLVGDVPRILAAAAAASIQTGAPIMVHTNAAARTGLATIEALTRHGVDPAKVVIAHAGDSNDLDYLHALLDAGAWLGCDRFNIPRFNPDADRVRTLATLVAEGHADRIHLGHDAAAFIDFMYGDPRYAELSFDYVHISRRILPALREAGVTQAQLDQMLIENPRRFFG